MSFQVQLNLPDVDQPITSGLFAEMPPNAQSMIKRGLADLAKLDAAHYKDVVAEVADAMSGGNTRRPSEVSANLGIALDQVGPLMSAAAMIVLSLRNRSTVDAAQWVRIAREDGFIAPADETPLAAFAAFRVQNGHDWENTAVQDKTDR